MNLTVPGQLSKHDLRIGPCRPKPTLISQLLMYAIRLDIELAQLGSSEFELAREANELARLDSLS
jgi:hypothetical protein